MNWGDPDLLALLATLDRQLGTLLLGAFMWAYSSAGITQIDTLT